MTELATVHPTAVLESERIGRGTRIWAFVRLQEGASVGEDCQLCDFATVSVDARIGDRVTIKEHAGIGQGTIIEDDVFIGPYVVTPNDMAPRSRRMLDVPEVRERYSDTKNWLRPSRIRRGASIGTAAIIGPGLEIGEFAMVGMGAIVLRDVEPHRFVLGNPARKLGWVCFCGEQLRRQDETDPWACPYCERLFDEVDGRLEAREALGLATQRRRPNPR